MNRLVAVGMFLLVCGGARGADDPPVSIPVRGRAPVVRPDFRMESDLVLVPVSVTDSKNHAVTGLSSGAFRVFEDRAEQQVVQFSREDAPLSVGIVLDSSGSMTGKLQKSREAMRQFLRFSNPEDEFFLVEFSSRARLTVPFTSDILEIQGKLQQAQPSGKTALLDAVCLAMETLRHARYPRRAILILSDGGDNDSRYTEAEMRERVRESDLWIYAMGIYDRQAEGQAAPTPKEIAGGQKLLEGLAEASGGRHFAVTSLVDLPVVAARISLELRNQYVLGYRPNNPHRDGKYHRVHVSVMDDRRLNVSWRPGYYGTSE
jgi:Ca-activated chloride channel family protein